MGCGASKSNASNVADPADKHKANKFKNAQLNKINSKLGKKSIVNSFVVKKGRDKRRTEEGERKDVVPRDLTVMDTIHEPEEPTEANTIQLPAESGALACPSFARSSMSGKSGPSFKMQRGKLGQLLEGMKSEESDDSVNYKQLLYSEDVKDLLKGISYIRDQLSVVNPPVGAIRASGVLPRLIQLLRRNDSRQLQYDVAWTLTNICSGQHEDCQEVVDQGAVPELLKLLDTCDDAPNVLEQAIWALGNIAADCADLQRYCLDEEIVRPLLGCIYRHSENTSVLRHALWLLSNLTRPKPQGDELLDTVPAVLTVIVSPNPDMEVATHACWSLAYLSSEEAVQDTLSESDDAAQVLMQLVTWVSGAPSNLTVPSLRILGNMCSGSSKHTQAVLDAGALRAFLDCLDSSQRLAIKKEVVWSLSNIAAGNGQQIEALLDAGAFKAVTDLLQSSEETLARECAYVLANPWAVKTVPTAHTVAVRLLEAGLVKEMVGLLKRRNQPSIVALALDGLTNAIKRGQQMMRDTAAAATSTALASDTAAPDAAEATDAAAAAPPSNPVVAAMKADGAEEILEGLCSADFEGHAKASALRNMVKFM